MARAERKGNGGVVLILSEYEASVLLSVTGKIGGAGKAHKVFTSDPLSIQNQLIAAGVERERTVHRLSSGAIMLPIMN